jgi:CRISPR-associated protein Csm4
MRFNVIFLKPKATFHLGEQGIGLEETSEIIHSDTLFSAICNAWLKFYVKKEDFKKILTNPPFLISSCFPYGKNIYFFPRPMLRLKVENKEFDLKDFKKIRFVSQGIFEKMIKNEEIEEVDFIQNKTLLLTSSEKESLKLDTIFKEHQVPRITIDRKTHASEIFYFSRIQFQQNCGYYFFVKYLDDKIKDKFETLIRFLGDVGIGGDRTTGHGQFIPEFSNIELSIPDNTKHFLTLSLFYPQKNQIKTVLSDKPSYDFIKRKGWVHSPDYMNLRRKTIRMFIEGSVFCGHFDSTYGKLVDTKPDGFNMHSVYRYGYAFPIGVRIK